MKKLGYIFGIFVVLALLIVCFLSRADDVFFGGKKIRMQEANGCDVFAEKKLQGTFVLYDKTSDKIFYCNKKRMFEGKIPASTFKIVNALNALENKIVADENELFVWDGVERDLPAWNRDTSLATGMKNSTVWFYQEIARRTGEDKMQAFVSLLEYGNKNIGGGLDQFWLDGDLRISPIEQIDFLNKLYENKLPLSKETQKKVIKMITLEKGEGWALYGKTGLGELDKKTGPLGWLVGFSVFEDKSFIYAMNVDLGKASPAVRLEIVKKLLANNLALPKGN